MSNIYIDIMMTHLFTLVQPIFSVHLDSNYVFLGCEDSLRIIDVSAPDEPYEVGFIENVGSVRDIAVVGDQAYLVGDSDAKIRVVDISVPSEPRLSIAADTLGARCVWASHENVVVGSEKGFEIFAPTICTGNDVAGPRRGHLRVP